MLIIIISRLSSKLGHVGSKTRSLGQILEKPFVHSRGHSFDPKFMKFCQNENPYKIKFRSSSKLGHVESKSRSLGQILDKPCIHSRGHSLEQMSVKLCQNVNSHKSESSSKLGNV